MQKWHHYIYTNKFNYLKTINLDTSKCVKKIDTKLLG